MFERIHLCHNGVELGAFPQDQIEAMLRGKVIAPDTLAWKAGEAEWKPLEKIVDTSIASRPPIPVHTEKRKKTDTQKLLEYDKLAETPRTDSSSARNLVQPTSSLKPAHTGTRLGKNTQNALSSEEGAISTKFGNDGEGYSFSYPMDILLRCLVGIGLVVIAFGVCVMVICILAVIFHFNPAPSGAAALLFIMAIWRPMYKAAIRRLGLRPPPLMIKGRRPWTDGL